MIIGLITDLTVW